MHEELLAKLKPDPDALLTAISSLVDDTMLEEIANADYGSEFEEHLEQLRKIRDHNEGFANMGWNPREVLALTRWIEPDQVWSDARQTWVSADTVDVRGYTIRAFACAVLLRAGAEPSNRGCIVFDGENQTLAQLLVSLPIIGQPIQEAALRFLAWRAQDLPEMHEEGPFYILALLILVLRTGAALAPGELEEIADWLFATEAALQSEKSFYAGEKNPWLLGLTLFNQRHNVWQKLGEEIVGLSDDYKDFEAGQDLRLIANLLTGNPESSSGG